jgi:hypothetical protein
LILFFLFRAELLVEIIQTLYIAVVAGV